MPVSVRRSGATPAPWRAADPTTSRRPWSGPARPGARGRPGQIGDVILGCANGAGEDNRNVARMAVLLAGLPVTVPGRDRQPAVRQQPAGGDGRLAAGRDRRRRGRGRRWRRVDEPGSVGAAEAGARVPGRQRDPGLDDARLAAGEHPDARGVDRLARRVQRAARRRARDRPRAAGRVRGRLPPAGRAGLGRRLLRRPGAAGRGPRRATSASVPMRASRPWPG